jgi:hypothetical protein
MPYYKASFLTDGFLKNCLTTMLKKSAAKISISARKLATRWVK